MHIESTATSECPTSIATPEIEWLLQQFHSSRIAAKSGGAMYGQDANLWPAWWADALETLTFARAHADSIQGIVE